MTTTYPVNNSEQVCTLRTAIAYISVLLSVFSFVHSKLQGIESEQNNNVFEKTKNEQENVTKREETRGNVCVLR